ncbi:MAG: hypothetical protein K9W42_10390 [Candidatus Heimdallarchaeota archaeon]|nr:hypothetical protein [Candidatus Heimdallarchaeota archaeon]
MTTLKEDTKEIAIAIGYDFLIVAFLFSWIAAIILALVEISLWVVFGVFLLGCLFFFSVVVISKNQEQAESENKDSSSIVEADSEPSK